MNIEMLKLGKLYTSLMNSELIDFATIAKHNGIMGVYTIFSPNSEVLYVGYTKNYKVRFGTDLKHEVTHSLLRKWLRDGVFHDRNSIKDYLQAQCRYRICFCESKHEAMALEHFAIWVLNPKYNS